jgi:hypothetical protein
MDGKSLIYFFELLNTKVGDLRYFVDDARRRRPASGSVARFGWERRKWGLSGGGCTKLQQALIYTTFGNAVTISERRVGRSRHDQAGSRSER